MSQLARSFLNKSVQVVQHDDRGKGYDKEYYENQMKEMYTEWKASSQTTDDISKMDSIVILFEQHLLDISPTELEELFSPASEYINHVIFNLRSHLVTLSPDLKQNGEQLFDFLTQNATCQSHLNVLSRLLIDSQIPRKSLMTTLVQIVDQLIFTLADLDDEFVEQHGGLETVVKLATTLSEISLSSFTHPLCLESLQSSGELDSLVSFVSIPLTQPLHLSQQISPTSDPSLLPSQPIISSHSPTPSSTRFVFINLVFNILRTLFTSPLKPDRALALHSSEVVKTLLEGAGRMMRNGMWQTKLKWQTTFPDSSFGPPSLQEQGPAFPFISEYILWIFNLLFVLSTNLPDTDNILFTDFITNHGYQKLKQLVVMFIIRDEFEETLTGHSPPFLSMHGTTSRTSSFFGIDGPSSKTDPSGHDQGIFYERNDLSFDSFNSLLQDVSILISFLHRFSILLKEPNALTTSTIPPIPPSSIDTPIPPQSHPSIRLSSEVSLIDIDDASSIRPPHAAPPSVDPSSHHSSYESMVEEEWTSVELSSKLHFRDLTSAQRQPAIWAFTSIQSPYTLPPVAMNVGSSEALATMSSLCEEYPQWPLLQLHVLTRLSSILKHPSPAKGHNPPNRADLLRSFHDQGVNARLIRIVPKCHLIVSDKILTLFELFVRMSFPTTGNRLCSVDAELINFCNLLRPSTPPTLLPSILSTLHALLSSSPISLSVCFCEVDMLESLTSLFFSITMLLVIPNNSSPSHAPLTSPISSPPTSISPSFPTSEPQHKILSEHNVLLEEAEKVRNLLKKAGLDIEATGSFPTICDLIDRWHDDISPSPFNESSKELKNNTEMDAPQESSNKDDKSPQLPHLTLDSPSPSRSQLDLFHSLFASSYLPSWQRLISQISSTLIGLHRSSPDSEHLSNFHSLMNNDTALTALLLHSSTSTTSLSLLEYLIETDKNQQNSFIRIRLLALLVVPRSLVCAHLLSLSSLLLSDKGVPVSFVESNGIAVLEQLIMNEVEYHRQKREFNEEETEHDTEVTPDTLQLTTSLPVSTPDFTLPELIPHSFIASYAQPSPASLPFPSQTSFFPSSVSPHSGEQQTPSPSEPKSIDIVLLCLRIVTIAVNTNGSLRSSVLHSDILTHFSSLLVDTGLLQSPTHSKMIVDSLFDMAYEKPTETKELGAAGAVITTVLTRQLRTSAPLALILSLLPSCPISIQQHTLTNLLARIRRSPQTIHVATQHSLFGQLLVLFKSAIVNPDDELHESVVALAVELGSYSVKMEEAEMLVRMLRTEARKQERELARLHNETAEVDSAITPKKESALSSLLPSPNTPVTSFSHLLLLTLRLLSVDASHPHILLAPTSKPACVSLRPFVTNRLWPSNPQKGFSISFWFSFGEKREKNGIAELFSVFHAGKEVNEKLTLLGLSYHNSTSSFILSSSSSLSTPLTHISFPFTPQPNHWHHLTLSMHKRRFQDASVHLFVDGTLFPKQKFVFPKQFDLKMLMFVFGSDRIDQSKTYQHWMLGSFMLCEESLKMKEVCEIEAVGCDDVSLLAGDVIRLHDEKGRLAVVPLPNESRKEEGRIREWLNDWNVRPDSESDLLQTPQKLGQTPHSSIPSNQTGIPFSVVKGMWEGLGFLPSTENQTPIPTQHCAEITDLSICDEDNILFLFHPLHQSSQPPHLKNLISPNLVNMSSFKVARLEGQTTLIHPSTLTSSLGSRGDWRLLFWLIESSLDPVSLELAIKCFISACSSTVLVRQMQRENAFLFLPFILSKKISLLSAETFLLLLASFVLPSFVPASLQSMFSLPLPFIHPSLTTTAPILSLPVAFFSLCCDPIFLSLLTPTHITTLLHTLIALLVPSNPYSHFNRDRCREHGVLSHMLMLLSILPAVSEEFDNTTTLPTPTEPPLSPSGRMFGFSSSHPTIQQTLLVLIELLLGPEWQGPDLRTILEFVLALMPSVEMKERVDQLRHTSESWMKVIASKTGELRDEERQKQEGKHEFSSVFTRTQKERDLLLLFFLHFLTSIFTSATPHNAELFLVVFNIHLLAFISNNPPPIALAAFRLLALLLVSFPDFLSQFTEKNGFEQLSSALVPFCLFPSFYTLLFALILRRKTFLMNSLFSYTHKSWRGDQTKTGDLGVSQSFGSLNKSKPIFTLSLLMQHSYETEKILVPAVTALLRLLETAHCFVHFDHITGEIGKEGTTSTVTSTDDCSQTDISAEELYFLESGEYDVYCVFGMERKRENLARSHLSPTKSPVPLPQKAWMSVLFPCPSNKVPLQATSIIVAVSDALRLLLRLSAQKKNIICLLDLTWCLLGWGELELNCCDIRYLSDKSYYSHPIFHTPIQTTKVPPPPKLEVQFIQSHSVGSVILAPDRVQQHNDREMWMKQQKKKWGDAKDQSTKEESKDQHYPINPCSALSSLYLLQVECQLSFLTILPLPKGKPKQALPDPTDLQQMPTLLLLLPSSLLSSATLTSDMLASRRQTPSVPDEFVFTSLSYLMLSLISLCSANPSPFSRNPCFLTNVIQFLSILTFLTTTIDDPHHLQSVSDPISVFPSFRSVLRLPNVPFSYQLFVQLLASLHNHLRSVSRDFALIPDINPIPPPHQIPSVSHLLHSPPDPNTIDMHAPILVEDFGSLQIMSKSNLLVKIPFVGSAPPPLPSSRPPPRPSPSSSPSRTNINPHPTTTQTLSQLSQAKQTSVTFYVSDPKKEEPRSISDSFARLNEMMRVWVMGEMRRCVQRKGSSDSIDVQSVVDLKDAPSALAYQPPNETSTLHHNLLVSAPSDSIPFDLDEEQTIQTILLLTNIRLNLYSLVVTPGSVVFAKSIDTSNLFSNHPFLNSSRHEALRPKDINGESTERERCFFATSIAFLLMLFDMNRTLNGPSQPRPSFLKGWMAYALDLLQHITQSRAQLVRSFFTFSTTKEQEKLLEKLKAEPLPSFPTRLPEHAERVPEKEKKGVMKSFLSTNTDPNAERTRSAFKSVSYLFFSCLSLSHLLSQTNASTITAASIPPLLLNHPPLSQKLLPLYTMSQADAWLNGLDQLTTGTFDPISFPSFLESNTSLLEQCLLHNGQSVTMSLVGEMNVRAGWMKEWERSRRVRTFLHLDENRTSSSLNQSPSMPVSPISSSPLSSPPLNFQSSPVLEAITRVSLEAESHRLILTGRAQIQHGRRFLIWLASSVEMHQNTHTRWTELLQLLYGKTGILPESFQTTKKLELLNEEGCHELAQTQIGSTQSSLNLSSLLPTSRPISWALIEQRGDLSNFPFSPADRIVPLSPSPTVEHRWLGETPSLFGPLSFMRGEVDHLFRELEAERKLEEEERMKAQNLLSQKEFEKETTKSDKLLADLLSQLAFHVTSSLVSIFTQPVFFLASVHRLVGGLDPQPCLLVMTSSSFILVDDVSVTPTLFTNQKKARPRLSFDVKSWSKRMIRIGTKRRVKRSWETMSVEKRITQTHDDDSGDDTKLRKAMDQSQSAHARASVFRRAVGFDRHHIPLESVENEDAFEMQAKFDQFLVNQNSDIFAPAVNQTDQTTHWSQISSAIIASHLSSAISTISSSRHSIRSGSSNSLPFTLSFKIGSVLFIIPRRFLHMHNSLELVCDDGTSFFLIFASQQQRNQAYSFLSERIQMMNPLYTPQDSLNQSDKSAVLDIDEDRLWRVARMDDITKEWQRSDLSTFRYLLTANSAAGRSFADMNQYPVFPWILRDYWGSSLDFTQLSTFRNLELPMGAQTQEREDKAKDQFEGMLAVAEMEAGIEHRRGEEPLPLLSRLQAIGSMHSGPDDDTRQRTLRRRVKTPNTPTADPNTISFTFTTQPYHFGSHYSNAGVVLYLLTRVEPFVSLEKHIHSGRFDNPDRIFHSLSEVWRSASEGMVYDFKELTPEFFSSPAVLKAHTLFGEMGFRTATMNMNQMNLSISSARSGRGNRGAVLQDVVLPAWAHKDAERFVWLHRQALESPIVSAQLGKWMDLVFGIKQRGIEAVKAGNTFHMLTYSDNVNLETIEDKVVRKSVKAQIHNFGQTPAQVFHVSHPARHPRPESGSICSAWQRIVPEEMTEVGDEPAMNGKWDGDSITVPGEDDVQIRFGGEDGGIVVTEGDKNSVVSTHSHLHRGPITAACLYLGVVGDETESVLYPAVRGLGWSENDWMGLGLFSIEREMLKRREEEILNNGSVGVEGWMELGLYEESERKEERMERRKRKRDERSHISTEPDAPLSSINITRSLAAQMDSLVDPLLKELSSSLSFSLLPPSEPPARLSSFIQKEHKPVEVSPKMTIVEATLLPPPKSDNGNKQELVFSILDTPNMTVNDQLDLTNVQPPTVLSTAQDVYFNMPTSTSNSSSTMKQPLNILPPPRTGSISSFVPDQTVVGRPSFASSLSNSQHLSSPAVFISATEESRRNVYASNAIVIGQHRSSHGNNETLWNGKTLISCSEEAFTLVTGGSDCLVNVWRFTAVQRFASHDLIGDGMISQGLTSLGRHEMKKMKGRRGGGGESELVFTTDQREGQIHSIEAMDLAKREKDWDKLLGINGIATGLGVSEMNENQLQHTMQNTDTTPALTQPRLSESRQTPQVIRTNSSLYTFTQTPPASLSPSQTPSIPQQSPSDFEITIDGMFPPKSVLTVGAGCSLHRRVSSVQHLRMIGRSSDSVLLPSARKEEGGQNWNKYNCVHLTTLRGHKAPIRCVDCDGGSEVAASGDEAGMVIVWDLKNLCLRHRLVFHSSLANLPTPLPSATLVPPKPFSNHRLSSSLSHSNPHPIKAVHVVPRTGCVYAGTKWGVMKWNENGEPVLMEGGGVSGLCDVSAIVTVGSKATSGTNERHVLTGHEDGRIGVWEVREKKVVQEYTPTQLDRLEKMKGDAQRSSSQNHNPLDQKETVGELISVMIENVLNDAWEGGTAQLGQEKKGFKQTLAALRMLDGFSGEKEKREAASDQEQTSRQSRIASFINTTTSTLAMTVQRPRQDQPSIVPVLAMTSQHQPTLSRTNKDWKGSEKRWLTDSVNMCGQKINQSETERGEGVVWLGESEDWLTLFCGSRNKQKMIFGVEEDTARTHWVKDESSEVCQLCGTKFTTNTRRHHCRRCGNLICGKCCSERMKVAEFGFVRKMVRVCDVCVGDILRINLPGRGVCGGVLNTEELTENVREGKTRIPSIDSPFTRKPERKRDED